MVRVEEADQLILSKVIDFGSETIPFQTAVGRVLAEDILTDRDLPPFHRVSMDGIAIRWSAFEQGVRSFRMAGLQPAGIAPLEIQSDTDCIEIMTGASLPASVDTVIRYEDLVIADGIATVQTESILKNQNIHFQGRDKKAGELALQAPVLIDPPIINMLASLGKSTITVKALPRVVIISTGDELKEVDSAVLPWEIRQSNNHTIRAVLEKYRISAQLLHIADDPVLTEKKMNDCLKDFDVILVTGGISMGKLDFVPQALESAGVKKIFHKVEQRPGKPFWFGADDNNCVVFAFPGNPVSTFMCLHRYFVPWLEACLGILSGSKLFAVLDEEIRFAPPLQYFLQVKLRSNSDGRLIAHPSAGNGSGDYANLLDSEAFMELPAEQTIFKKGEVFRIWPFKRFYS